MNERIKVVVKVKIMKDSVSYVRVLLCNIVIDVGSLLIFHETVQSQPAKYSIYLENLCDMFCLLPRVLVLIRSPLTVVYKCCTYRKQCCGNLWSCLLYALYMSTSV